MTMNQFDIKIGKLYRLQKGISCWNDNLGEVINDPSKESIVMVLSPNQRLTDIEGFKSCGNFVCSVLLETGELGWIFDYNYCRMELLEE